MGRSSEPSGCRPRQDLGPDLVEDQPEVRMQSQFLQGEIDLTLRNIFFRRDNNVGPVGQEIEYGRSHCMQLDYSRDFR